MRKKTLYRLRIMSLSIALPLLLTVVPVFAQEEEYSGVGLYAEISSSVNAFKITDNQYSNSDIRGQGAQNHTDMIFPTETPNFWDDSYLLLGYDGEKYGGSFRVREQPDVKVWARFGFIKASLGNNLKSVYADSLGADPELRIYVNEDAQYDHSWNTAVNPDNITDDVGVLVEALLDPVTIAVATGYFLPKYEWFKVPDTNIYHDKETSAYRYGARIGWDLGDFGKLNASYRIRHEGWPTKYQYKTNTEEVVPKSADAEVYYHEFGLYGSLHPLKDLSVTIGYNGMITSYLNEYYLADGSQVETGYPLVFRNGVNLNATYQVTDRVSLRTDNCLTVWRDKNYKLMGTSNTDGKWANFNLEPKRTADTYKEIDHFVLWNGLGINYKLTSNLSLGGYLRNMIGLYSVSGSTSVGTKADYSWLRDTWEAKVSLDLQLSSRSSVGIGLTFFGSMTQRSRDLNAESRSIFIDHIGGDNRNPKPDPVETFDKAFSVSIPLSVTMRL
ncbi:hypothetical protein AGMMS50267_12080 [Spirochaetia bacterium]|nr:hypothetical protein AGMMS50267_12080 [Spirochaetia bacterium]